MSGWPKAASHAGLIQPTQLLDMGCSEVEGRVLEVLGFKFGLFCGVTMPRLYEIWVAVEGLTVLPMV